MAPSSFELMFSTKMTDDDREELITLLQGFYEISHYPNRSTTALWLTFIAITKDLGTIAASSASLIKLAQEIAKWRDRKKTAKQEIEIKFRRKSGDEISLDRASITEIENWLQEQRQQPE